jgi:hypothetical protein
VLEGRPTDDRGIVGVGIAGGGKARPVPSDRVRQCEVGAGERVRRKERRTIVVAEYEVHVHSVSDSIGNDRIDFAIERVEIDRRFRAFDQPRDSARFVRVFDIAHEPHERVLRRAEIFRRIGREDRGGVGAELRTDRRLVLVSREARRKAPIHPGPPFVPSRADHDRYTTERAGLIEEPRLIGDFHSVHNRRPLRSARFEDLLEQCRRARQQDLILRRRSKTSEDQRRISVGAAEHGSEVLALRFGVGRRSPSKGSRSALHDCPVKEARASRRH